MTGSKLSPAFPSLTLIIGGARSGKSRFAEELALSSGLRPVLIATAEGLDAEMRQRIERHRADRAAGWTTIEEPLDLARRLQAAEAGTAVLVDCATLWLSNHLIAGGDLAECSAALAGALAGCKTPVVVVSNEVGWSVVPDNALARQFADAQGRLNQRIADCADLVIAVIAGLPLILKGRMPA